MIVRFVSILVQLDMYKLGQVFLYVPCGENQIVEVTPRDHY